MAYDYASTAQTVLRLLARFGAAATLTRPGVSAYDPTAGTVTAAPVVDAVTAAVFPYVLRHLDDRRIDGTLVFATDKQAYIASPVGLAEPKPGDVLLWQGVNLTVVTCKNLAPAGVSVIYEVQARA